MNAAKQAAWLFVALFALACSGWFFAGSSPVIKLDAQTLSTTTDRVLSDLTVQQFDEKGRLVHYLQTPLMQHIPAQNTHWLKSPHIMITQEDQPTWDIHAEEATALHGSQQITLNKNVVLHQQKGTRTAESTFKTESITYFPSEKLATTLLDVTFEQPGNKIQSTGMKAYLAEKRVLLLSKARGTYEPNHG